MALEPDYGETLVSFEEVDALTHAARQMHAELNRRGHRIVAVHRAPVDAC